MDSNQKAGRITGVLLLFVFISGIITFQYLQGPVLFAEDFITKTSANSNKVISSILLGIFSGLASIIVAIILLPIFKKYNAYLAYAYVAFCILNFVSIMIDNLSVIALLELSQDFVKNGAVNSETFKIMGTLVYQKHWWTHYLFLLISCVPVFVLYYTLFISKLVPRILSIFGIIAVGLMFIEMLCSILGHSIGMDMLIPIGLIQLILPLWLIYKGLYSSKLKAVVHN
jgi:hypothetical protein